MTPDLESLRALAEKIATLESELRSIPAHETRRIDEYKGDIRGLKALLLARVPALLLRLEKCEKALRPFAEALKAQPDRIHHPGGTFTMHVPADTDKAHCVTVGDLRAAALCFQHSEKKADV